MILKAIFARKARALLTIFGVAVGIATFVSVRGFAIGFEREWTDMYRTADVDVIVLGSAFMSRTISDSAVERAQALPVADLAFGVLATVESYAERNLLLIGVPGGAGLDGREFLSGRAFGSGPGVREVVLGELCAQLIGKNVGDEIEIVFETFRVSGVFRADSVYESGGLLLDLAELQRLIDEPRRLTGVHIRLTPQARATDAARAEALAAVRGEFPQFFVMPADEVAENYQALSMLRALTGGVSLIAVLLGVIGVTNTLTMSIMENTRSIGILRALGWRWRRVFGLVMAESMLFSLLGGLLGCALAEVLTRAIVALPIMSGFVDAGLSVSLRLQGIAMALGMGLLCGLYPSWRVWRIDPIQALRHE